MSLKAWGVIKLMTSTMLVVSSALHTILVCKHLVKKKRASNFTPSATSKEGLVVASA